MHTHSIIIVPCVYMVACGFGLSGRRGRGERQEEGGMKGEGEEGEKRSVLINWKNF